MLTIKLSKLGKKNHKLFRVIITEKGRDPYGRALEVLGSYDQYKKNLQVKGERVNYWISKGAQMTPTVNNLMITNNIVEGDKIVPKKKVKVSKKREDQLKAKADKRKAAEEAAKPAPEAAPAVSEEVPVSEEAPVEGAAETPAETPAA